MKTIKLRLTLTVELDPQGETQATLERNLNQVVRDAVNNGTLTGETAATVEKYFFTVEKVTDKIKPKAKRNQRKAGEHRFADCGGNPRCVTCGCDEDDAFVGGQECSFGK